MKIMNDKIIIKNFGPLKQVELDLKEVIVLIGPQASGKSTIAKLIHFFKYGAVFFKLLGEKKCIRYYLVSIYFL